MGTSFAKTPTGALEEIFMVFTFAPSSMKKPHPQGGAHAQQHENCYHAQITRKYL